MKIGIAAGYRTSRPLEHTRENLMRRARAGLEERRLGTCPSTLVLRPRPVETAARR